MPAGLATILFWLGIVGLFRLSRDGTQRTSPALWIPVVWLAIGASRSLSQWLGGATDMASPDQYLDGSPLDALLFTALEVAAVMTLIGRSERAGAFLRANWPLVLFFLFGALSVLWSDFPLVALKRWIKAVGNFAMVLVVLTDPAPRPAVRRLLARAGFLLIPLSVLFIKYYPELGRGFDAWTGRAYNMGVGLDKNALGTICLIFGLGSLWQLLSALRQRPRLTGPLVAHGATLAMALWLFSLADSATSFGCFLVGATLIVLTSRPAFLFSPLFAHAIAAGIVVLCLVGLFVNTDAGLLQALGRDATLTTRTLLWADVLQVPVDPLLGTGFESFWLGERAEALWTKYWWHPNQAHNGYLEVFLNSGWVGITLLGLVMVWGYRDITRTLSRDPELGGLRFAFFLAAVLYNLTEAAFKVMHPVWVVFLLAVTIVPASAQLRMREIE
jgi:exopolysaccharide production protein ExoQ